MRKFMMVSMVALSFISAAQAAPILKDGKEIISKHPLAVEYRSKEYGGTKDAIDAYSDGVGVYVGTVNPDKRVNQAPMAELVEKYGESAKAKGVMVAEEVAYGSVATEAERDLLARVVDVNAIHPDGSACNDGNDKTVGDKYLNGICVGTLPIFSNIFRSITSELQASGYCKSTFNGTLYSYQIVCGAICSEKFTCKHYK